MTALPIVIALHVLAAVIWVGGMFFAYMALRPAAGPLEPPVRLALWARVFGKFFPWVWAAVLVLLVTGYGMGFTVFGGFAKAGLHIHLMQGLGILMMLLFLHIYFGPFRRLRQAVERQDWKSGGEKLGQIRMIIGINLILGLLVVAIATGGRYWVLP
ncbi:MAG: CopD family protein [Gammaproteobacteria bacterium]